MRVVYQMPKKSIITQRNSQLDIGHSCEKSGMEVLVSPPKRATGNKMSERVQSYEELTGQIQLTQFCEKLSSNIFLQLGKRTKFDKMRTTDGKQ